MKKILINLLVLTMILSGCFHNNGEYEAQNDGIKINDNYFIKESEDKDEQGNKIIYVWHEDNPIYRISFPLLEGYYYADENKYLDDHLLVLMESNENNNNVLLDTIKSSILRYHKDLEFHFPCKKYTLCQELCGTNV